VFKEKDNKDIFKLSKKLILYMPFNTITHLIEIKKIDSIKKKKYIIID